MAKKPRIRWVKDYKDIPGYKKGEFGGYQPWNKTIWLVKGKSPVSTGHHEMYHAIKRHPQQPRNPLEYAKQEIEANLYAYKKCGQPKRILMRLRGIYIELLHRYNLSDRQTISIIRRAILSQKNLPKGWREDYAVLRKEWGRL